MRLHHAALVCRSRRSADRFYRDVLGLKTIKETALAEDFMNALFGMAISSELIKYGNEHITLEVFIPGTPPAPPSPLAHCCLAVEDRDAFIARCEGVGIAVRKVPKGGSFVVFIQDFDGNQFEIKETN
jgi:catechol 2,3-dioxygenase-like lactoylglutathione lyase family enzyme